MSDWIAFAIGFVLGGLLIGRWVYLAAVEGAEEWVAENLDRTPPPPPERD